MPSRGQFQRQQDGNSVPRLLDRRLFGVDQHDAGVGFKLREHGGVRTWSEQNETHRAT